MDIHLVILFLIILLKVYLCLIHAYWILWNAGHISLHIPLPDLNKVSIQLLIASSVICIILGIGIDWLFPLPSSHVAYFKTFTLKLLHFALKASNAIFASLIRGNLAYIIAKGRARFLMLPFHFKIIFCLLFLLWFLGGRRVLVFHVQHVYPCQPSSPDLPPATVLSFPFLSSVFLFTSFSPSAYKQVQIPFSQKVNFPSILSSL